MKSWKSSNPATTSKVTFTSKDKIYTSGLYGKLNPQEQEVLDKLKSDIKAGKFANVCEQCNDDIFLLRFLRGRQFKYDRVAKFFQASLNWRKSFKVDKITKEEKFPHMLYVSTMYPRGFHGLDKKGRPIFIDATGRLDFQKILSLIDRDTLIRQFIMEYEYTVEVLLPACSVVAGRPIEQSLIIVDMRSMKLKNFNIKTRAIVSKLSAISQSNYPDILGEMYIVNTPKIFQIVWKFVKTLIDENTAKKIHLVRHDQDWREMIKDSADYDAMPAFLGGLSFEKYKDVKCKKSFGPWRDPEVLREVQKQRPWNTMNVYGVSFLDYSEEMLGVVEKIIMSKEKDAEYEEAVAKHKKYALTKLDYGPGGCTDVVDDTAEEAEEEVSEELLKEFDDEACLKEGKSDGEDGGDGVSTAAVTLDEGTAESA